MTGYLWLAVIALCVAIAAWEIVEHRRRNRDREALDCGCDADGRATYFCMNCRHTRCAEHRDDLHNCCTRPGGEA